MVKDHLGPVTERERIGEIDVLRGIALFGVLTMNFVGFASECIMANETRRAAQFRKVGGP